MYKLVVIGGKKRGTEFILEEGINTIGRDSGCNFVVDIQGVSKKHLQVELNKDRVFVEDLGSANGTFVNGKLIQKMPLENGDKIAIPDLIFQLVFVREKKVIIKKNVIKDKEDVQEQKGYLESAPKPENFLGKLIYLFKYRFMSIIHGFNEEYEWRAMLGILFFIFILVTVTLTVAPILQTSKQLLIREIGRRGAHYAEEISRLNARNLESKNLEGIDSKFLAREDGVLSYELFDLEGNIFAPLEKLNQQISDPFSIQARDEFMRNIKSGKGDILIRKFLDDQDETQIGIARLINAYSAKSGREEPVGIISIRFLPSSLRSEAAQNSQAYLESIVMSSIVAILFFGIVYYLTVRPIEEFRLQVDEALRFSKKEIEGKLLMEELGPLKSTISSVLQRIRELNKDDGEENFNEVEPDGPYLDILKEFLQGSGVPAMILDAERNIQSLNLEGEDLLGIRESSSQGQNIIDTAREKGLAATIVDLCDQSGNAQGKCQKGTYELTGNEYQIFVTSLIGKDSFVKGHYITFIKED